MTYLGLERATQLDPDEDNHMSRSAIGNRGPGLDREGLIRNITPYAHGRSLWAATPAGIHAAGFDHVAVEVNGPEQAVAAACLADWTLQHAEQLTLGQQLIPRSRIAPHLEGAPYELPVQLDRLSAISLSYSHRPAFVIDQSATPTGLGSATGYDLLAKVPSPGVLKSVIRRYAASAVVDRVVIGSHRPEILEHVLVVAAELGLADMVTVELYVPSRECEWVLESGG